MLVSSYPFYKTLSKSRKRVITAMYNALGDDGFAGFRELITALSNEDYGKAASEMLTTQWGRSLTEIGVERAFRLSEIMRNNNERY